MMHSRLRVCNACVSRILSVSSKKIGSLLKQETFKTFRMVTGWYVKSISILINFGC